MKFEIGFRTAVSVISVLLLALQPLFAPISGRINEQSVSAYLELSNDLIDSITPPSPEQGPNPTVLWSFFASPNSILIYNTVEIGDINNDGVTDIVSAYDGLGLRLWLGSLNGTLQTATPPANSGNYNDIKIGDLNNDGKPDIAATKQGGISTWHGNGSGNGWSADVGPNVTGTFNAVHLADVNLDGNLDLICGVAGTGIRKGIQVFLGNGNGGWSNGDTNLPFSVKYNGIYSADFNNDGKADIVAAGDFGVDAWTGNGAGSWVLADSGLPSSGAFSDVELADLDSDGDLDIVAAGSNNNGLRVCKGNGAGVWTLNVTDLPLTGTYTAVEISDVNLDGYKDIITSSSNTNQAVWTGDGAFNWYLQTTGLPSGNSYSDISLGDANNDAHPDICVANANAGIEIWISSAERNVNFWTSYPSPATTLTVNDIDICDLNLDGKQDIVYASQSNGLSIWTGNSAGSWTSFPSPVTSGTAFSVLSADYNNDGKTDLIASQSNGIRAWSGNGAGAWTLSNIITTGSWYGLVAGDFNDDGKLDVAGGSGTNGGLFVWNGNGAGTWTRTFTLPLTGTYQDLQAADFNLDGSLDIITAAGGIRVFLGNSNNGWTESSTGLPDSTNSYKYVAVADLNRNGKPDFTAASETAGTKAWHGNGNGQWNLDSNIDATHSSGLAASDFSIDGLPDTAVGSKSNSGIIAMSRGVIGWNNLSAGLPLTGNYSAIQFVDINQDGKQDIITYNNTAQSAAIWIGDYVSPPAQSFNIGPLIVGWNLVSIPLMPENATMPTALTDLDHDTIWTTVKSYNQLDSMDPWKSYSYGRPEGLQDLIEINESDGIWLYIPNATYLGDGYIRIQGFEPVTTEITLNTGWNLVGYPSSQTAIASASLPAYADIVSVFQVASPFIADVFDLSLVTLEPGKGYWIHVSSDCVWNVEF